jgi:uncharacterized protein YdbL (DUF1318 family)
MKIQHGDQVRDMTAEERANYEQVIADAEAAAATVDAIAAAKASAKAKLGALGLSDDEINALVG